MYCNTQLFEAKVVSKLITGVVVLSAKKMSEKGISVLNASKSGYSQLMSKSCVTGGTENRKHFATNKTNSWERSSRTPIC